MSAIDSLLAKYNAAVADENAAWAQHVEETTDKGLQLQPMYFKSGDDDAFQARAPVVALNVCNNGVPAIRRFMAGPAKNI